MQDDAKALPEAEGDSRYARLMATRFPQIDHAYGERDTMLYALGVGAGDHGPGSDLDLTYEAQLVALPTMAVTLAYPGFWYRDLPCGLDHVRTVHASERFTLHRRLPVAARVTARPRVVAIHDRGEGRGALVASERTIVDVATGQALATVRQTAFCRADGGLGGPLVAPPPPHPVPDRPPDVVSDISTSPRAALIYRLSGDYNPLHLDPATASAAGFPAPILHGLSTYGYIGRRILSAFRRDVAETIITMDCRFTGYVLPGDVLRSSFWVDGRTVSFRVAVGERTVIDNGIAELGVPASATET